MKATIRHEVFETNSSSMHTLTIATQEQLDSWKSGKLKLIGYFLEGKFVDANSPELQESLDVPSWTYDEFIHQNDNGDGYDMSFDQDYPDPGSIIDNYDGTYTCHYQA